MATGAAHLLSGPVGTVRPSPWRSRARGGAVATIFMLGLFLIGWQSAKLLQSDLLGFVLADLTLLVGVAFYGAIRSPRTTRPGR